METEEQYWLTGRQVGAVFLVLALSLLCGWISGPLATVSVVVYVWAALRRA